MDRRTDIQINRVKTSLMIFLERKNWIYYVTASLKKGQNKKKKSSQQLGPSLILQHIQSIITSSTNPIHSRHISKQCFSYPPSVVTVTPNKPQSYPSFTNSQSPLPKNNIRYPRYLSPSATASHTKPCSYPSSVHSPLHARNTKTHQKTLQNRIKSTRCSP